MRVDIVIGERAGSGVTGTSTLRLTTDSKGRPRIWLGVSDNESPGGPFGLTRAQAKRLGARLLAWAAAD